jgi:hypothetical protein
MIITWLATEPKTICDISPPLLGAMQIINVGIMNPPMNPPSPP